MITFTMLIFLLSSTNGDDNISVATTQVVGFSSRTTCESEAKKINDLKRPVQRTDTRLVAYCVEVE